MISEDIVALQLVILGFCNDGYTGCRVDIF